MPDDLATRLAAALDRAEAEARGFRSDEAPSLVLRMVERDRALLADYASAQNLLGDAVSEGLSRTAKDLRAGCVVALCGEVERAVAFWGVHGGA